MKRLTGLALCATSVALSAPVAAEPLSVEEREALVIEGDIPEERDAQKPWLGLMIDAGVPDGANLAAVWRPYHWLRFHGGGSYNMVGFGLRGGLSLLPFDEWITPSVVVEGGHFFGGDLQGFVAEVVGEAPEGTPEDITYSYGNAHLGLELGSSDFTFYLRGGYSLIEATITPDANGQGEGLRFEGDARVSALTPSAKLGFVLYIL